MSRTLAAATPTLPSPAAVLELFKPITWFPPMWAFACGVVSSGQPIEGRWLFLIAGIALTGPLVCATSQAVNDWFDRHVDAINEPHRPIPSGRIPGRWGLWIAIIWTGVSLGVAALTGPWVLGATSLGLALAWAYSAPPLRLKRSGWWGPAAVALSYEGLTWFTGAAVMAGALPSAPILWLAGLYSLGAHGIMTLNDFKAIEGDRRTGLKSLPVTLGPRRAALLACAVMAVPQAVVVALLLGWERPIQAGIVGLSLALQGLAMARLLRDPARLAPWYNGTGVTLYVLGMMVAATAVATLGGAA
ncbi:chlorophyll synthase ChlG [Brevundimonas sp.]|jgi:chlorophyll synthase|uniref:chlorophyll synthase ChlG n=1 Tax=Brevundimonas sp. TaxID=1871086 RepID=UPI002E0FEA88|nr:chlorophyll synthase ChlG [Brevundimonas sp.]